MKTLSTSTLLLSLALLCFTGCKSPGLAEQVKASAPAMLIDDELVWQSDDRLSSQLESGKAFAGGGQSAGCTSCQ
jgi:hypothetical protein